MSYSILQRLKVNVMCAVNDKPETVKKRLDVYHTQTQPLIDFYTERKVLVEVDGTQSMDKVFDDIMKILGE